MKWDTIIVGCSAHKLLPKEVPEDGIAAMDLYESSYWSLKRRFGEVCANEWWILSAEHGLLHPTTKIDYYDTNIADIDAEEWGFRAVRQMEEAAIFRDESIALEAGKDYLSPLLKAGIEDYDVQLDMLTRGDPIGKRQQILRQLIDDELSSDAMEW